MTDFKKELIHLLNKYSKESDSDTPDYMLAQYIINCLAALTQVTRVRDKWHGFKPFAKHSTDTNPDA